MFLNELGFTKKDFHDNIKDLQKVLGDIRLAWEEMPKELRRRFAGPPSAYIIDNCTLVIAPDFSDAYDEFVKMKVANEQDKKQW